LLSTKEVAHLPLPSPDALWRAPTSTVWSKALEQYRAPTLNEALHQLLVAGETDSMSPPGVAEEPSIYGEHGPFARLVMVLALLRGIIEMLEGRTTRVPRPSSLSKWLKQGLAIRGTGSTVDGQVALYKRALSRWRKAWDGDGTCKLASVKKAGQAGQTAQTSGAASDMSDDSLSTHSGSPTNKRAWPAELQPTLFTPLTASGATPLSDDALPLYWLAHVLVTHAASNQRLPLRSVESRTGAAGRNGAFAAKGGGPEMPDFRAMLRFAKNFVTRGEK
jgi:hypothetical protein